MNDIGSDISRHVWATRYRFAGGSRGERTIADSWHRIAGALAAVEAERDIVTPRTCDILAEILTERGDLRGALVWATAGVEHCIQRDDDAELQLLLRLRYRIRVDLGLDEDDYDKMLDGSRGPA